MAQPATDVMMAGVGTRPAEAGAIHDRRCHRDAASTCTAPLLIFTAAFAGLLVLVGVVLAFHTYAIPSASNVPTLRVGDIILASKLPYGFSRYALPVDLGFHGRLLGGAPRRGDVAVFKLPRDTRTDYIKRVIGLPGDSVQMKEGRLYLNGTIVPRQPVARIEAEGFDGQVADVPTYRETLPNGVAYTIIEIQGDMGFNDNTEVFKVPPGRSFVLGDNRDNSLDSRVSPEQGGVGFVPLDNLVARAEFVLYNPRRSERILKSIP